MISAPAQRLRGLGDTIIGTLFGTDKVIATTATTTIVTTSTLTGSSIILSGNVGIGTTVSTQKLSVYGATNPNIIRGNSTTPIALQCAVASGAGAYSNFAAAGDSIINALSGNLMLQTSNLNGGIYINTSNNVGIGTGNPSNTLTVYNITADNNTAPDYNPSSGQLLIQCGKSGSSKYAMAIGMDQTYGIGYLNAAGNGANQPICLQTRGGYVGIGTTSPAVALQVNGTIQIRGANNTMHFYNGSNNFIYATTYDGYTPNSLNNNLIIKSWYGLAFATHNDAVNITFNTRTGDANFSGNVTVAGGINITGINASGWALDVSNVGSGSMYLGGTAYLITNVETGGNATVGGFTQGTVGGLSARFQGGLVATGITKYSDYRIKKDILQMDNETSLQKIRLLEPVSYHFVDHIRNGTTIDYGFIAQNVQKIIPESIIYEQNYIPNIFDNATIINKNIIQLTTKHCFTINMNKIQIICEDDKRLELSISVLSPNSCRIESEINYSTCFVYGSYVKDMHILKHEMLFTIGISAIKEIDKTVTLLEKENVLLKDKVISQQSQLDKLLAWAATQGYTP
jgi:hypothetical protein